MTATEALRAGASCNRLEAALLRASDRAGKLVQAVVGEVVVG